MGSPQSFLLTLKILKMEGFSWTDGEKKKKEVTGIQVRKVKMQHMDFNE